MEIKKDEVISTFLKFLNDDTKGIYFGTPGDGIIYDAKRRITDTPNALFLGTPGAGKNFYMEKIIVDHIKNGGEVIYLTDPEDEYRQLASQFPDYLKILPPVTQSTGSGAAPGREKCVTENRGTTKCQ